MPISGTFGGFPFDPEVYQGFVDQEATFSDSILASGILARDQSLATSLDNGGVPVSYTHLTLPTTERV